MSSPVSRGAWSVFSWSLVAAFGTYFCMYAFRKPFTAAKFEDFALWGVQYKVILVTAQVFGYMLSKFIGIKVVSEMPPGRRVALLLALIGVAELTLIGFGVTPVPYNFIWLFLNGIPLGMVFGLVMGFLEGRRQTEALMAGLCASFIVADGVVKSVGARILSLGVSEFWMPAVAGLVFVPPLLVFAGMLSRIPSPSESDVEARSERSTMNADDRWSLFWRYALGLTLIVVAYTLVTVLRSIRADFAPELWAGLQTAKPSDDVYGWTEFLVGLAVMSLAGATVLIRDNRTAFFAALGLAIGGTVLVMFALLGLKAVLLSPFAFMVIHGLGMYLPYIAVHTTIFERLLAMTRDRGTVGYLMYLADSFGYLGYVAVMLIRNFAVPQGDVLSFFLQISWIIAGLCLGLFVPAAIYFGRHPATQRVNPSGEYAMANRELA
jgi:hypothetical protein